MSPLERSNATDESKTRLQRLEESLGTPAGEEYLPADRRDRYLGEGWLGYKIDRWLARRHRTDAERLKK